MQTVKLTPKTRKDQNVVTRDGALFTVTGTADRVHFSTDDPNFTVTTEA